MHKQLVLALACLSLISVVNSMGYCDRGEEFTTSYMPNCEPSCDKPQRGMLFCSYQGSPGCRCERGLFRSPNGKCVTNYECQEIKRNNAIIKSECKWTEEYIPVYSRKCEATCQNPNVDSNSCPSGRLVLRSGGCRCRNGLLRNSKGQCVSPYYCQFELPYQQPDPYTPFNPYNPGFNPYNPDFNPYNPDFKPYNPDFNPYNSGLNPYNPSFNEYNNIYQETKFNNEEDNIQV